MTEFPKIELGKAIEWGIEALVGEIAGGTNAVSETIGSAVNSMTEFLMFFPPELMILLFAVLAWYITKSVKIGVGTLLGMAFIWNLRLWHPTMQTLSLVGLSTLTAIALGIPLGVIAAISTGFRRVIMPILDFMQTLPPFVYLIPAIPFFGLGATSALFSTVIFAMPPAIRLTALGIQGVPGELVEAVDAFGSTKWQKLIKLQLPLAAPSIKAGVNQTILLALSMVVIAAMIGAKGLGGVVWKAIQRLQPGMGFEAGIAIAIVAIILDRVLRNAQMGTKVQSKPTK